MEISSHILKVSGKAELPEAITAGHNYHVSMSGSIPSVTETDNENGTATRTYTFKPIKIELLDPLGKTLKLKDARSDSQIFRARSFGIWKQMPNAKPFEAFYHALMQNLIEYCPEIIEMYAKE